MADKHADAPNATEETRENRGNDCASQQACHSHQAGPIGSRRQLPPCSTMAAQRRSAAIMVLAVMIALAMIRIWRQDPSGIGAEPMAPAGDTTPPSLT
jgi:hypothetical protein